MNSNRIFERLASLSLIAQGLLIFAPLIVLGSAINWPASLSDPARVALPRLLENIQAVRLGYGIYFLYSVLFLFTSILTVRLLASKDKENVLVQIASGAGAVSALARTIGIIRWLMAAPALAALYTSPAATVTTREIVSVSFETLNVFGGSIGEQLGVTMFASIWLILVSVLILQSGALPRWLGWFGLVATACMAVNLVEMFGVHRGSFITVTLVLFHLWLLFAGITLALRRQPVQAVIA